MAEAHREVTLNEGGKPIRLPMYRAVARKMGVTALKGSPHAQKHYLQMLLDLERGVSREHASVLGAALEQKAQLEAAGREWVASGRDEAAMPIHPADIVIDGATGDVTYYAALTEEELEARRKLIALQDEQQAIIDRVLDAAKRGEDDELMKLGRKIAESVFDSINDRLPPRFRQELRARPSEWDPTG